MKLIANILAAVFALVGVLILIGAAESNAGLGPVELVVGLIPIGLAVLLYQSSRQRS
jgi:hypothetical protein